MYNCYLFMVSRHHRVQLRVLLKALGPSQTIVLRGYSTIVSEFQYKYKEPNQTGKTTAIRLIAVREAGVSRYHGRRQPDGILSVSY